MSRYEVISYFEPLEHDDMAGVWAKIPVVNETLNRGTFEWVLWMDFDTLFTNMALKMESFMEDVHANHLDRLNTGQQWSDVDIIVAPDW